MPITLTGGAFQSPQGTTLASGKLILTLSQDAKVIAGGQVAPTLVSFTIGTGGNLSGTCQVLGNDELSPSGTYYRAIVTDANGNIVYGPQKWVLTGGGTLDVGTITPAQVAPVVLVNQLPIDKIMLDAANQDAVLTRSAVNTLQLAAGDRFLLQNLNNIRFANQFASLQAAHDDLPAEGGTILAPNGSTPFGPANTTSLLITKPLRLTFDNVTFTYAGTGQAIQCAVDAGAIIIEGSAAPDTSFPTAGTSISVTNTAANGIDVLDDASIVIRNISLIGPGSGTGKGIIVTGNGFVLDNTQTKYFGGNGTEIDGTRGNSNNGVLFRARSYFNGGQGFNTFGANSNAFVWIATDAQLNTGTNYLFTNSSKHTFVGLHAQPASDVTSVSFVNSRGNTGSLYIEPISPYAAAAVSFDADSKYNNLFLLNGRVVSDSGVGNQWFFAAPDAGAGIAGAGKFQWNTANAEDALNTILQIRRAGEAAELAKLGIYFKSGSFRSGFTVTEKASLNFIYNTAATSYTANFFNNAAEDAIDTATPVMSLDSAVNVKRIKASHGTALAVADWTLSAGWGDTAAVSAITGTDQAWNITVTCGGAGIGANPTVRLAFKDGTWTNAPIVLSKIVDGTGVWADLKDWRDATQWVMTYMGTPVDTKTYVISGIAMGR